MMLEINGLELSSIPTQSHKQLINVRINTYLSKKLQQLQKQSQSPKNQFQLSTDKKAIKAFVDPSELSYNSFENILNLDQYFFGPKFNDNKKLKLTVQNMQKVQNHYKFSIVDHQNILIQLHNMNLYSLPFNNLSRGGKRMIFSSLKLADALFEELKENFERNLDFQEKIQAQQSQYKEICENFNSVNHVFRLNCFSPQSGNFKSHYDTPFSDNHRKLFSKFTLLIYLTGGSNQKKSCLRIEDQKINQIPAFTGVIFDQRYEHEGWPYIQGDKVFLRTELIYYIKDVGTDEHVGQMFNKACYFHKESLYNHQDNIFAEELQKYSNQLFNHTARLRYWLEQKRQQFSVEQLSHRIQQIELRSKQLINQNIGQIQDKYLLKKNLQVIYVTDGNSFWFRDQFPLNLVAKLVLVDYFNGRMGQFSSKQVSEKDKIKIKSKPLDMKLIETFIPTSRQSQVIKGKMEEQKEPSVQSTQHQEYQRSIDESILRFLDLISFQGQKQNEIYPYDFQRIFQTEIQGFDLVQWHCGICRTSDLTVSDNYQYEARDVSRQRFYNKMQGIGVVLFNGQVLVSDDSIKIDQNKGQISFNDAFLNRTINFASCQCETYSRNKVIAKENIQVQGFLIPKIKFQRMTPFKGYKLQIDMFKNGFFHRAKVNISRPYAVKPPLNQHYEAQPFYDSQDQYVNSDNDFDEPGTKRQFFNHIDEQHENDFINKRRKK